MKLLKEVQLRLVDVDPSMNVITIIGRSQIEYQFCWEPKLGAHVRSYGGFDDARAVTKLNAEEEDLSGAVLPPGWAIRRAFVFEDVENERLTAATELLRQANLRLMFNADVEAAKESFSEEDLALLEKPLAEPVAEFLRAAGVAVPNDEWAAAHNANLAKDRGRKTKRTPAEAQRRGGGEE